MCQAAGVRTETAGGVGVASQALAKNAKNDRFRVESNHVILEHVMPDITTPAAHEVCKDDNDGAHAHVPDADDADPDAHNCCIGAEAELLTGG